MFTDPFHCAFRDRKLQPNYCPSLVTLTGLQTCLLPADPFFTCLISAYSRKTPHKSGKIFVKRAWNVARIQF